jgi:hypothetical protein
MKKLSFLFLICRFPVIIIVTIWFLLKNSLAEKEIKNNYSYFKAKEIFERYLNYTNNLFANYIKQKEVIQIWIGIVIYVILIYWWW